MRRVLIYAAIYGCIGAMVGAFVAIYTKDTPLPRAIVLQNGSATKATANHPSSHSTPSNAEVAEPTPTTNESSRED